MKYWLIISLFLKTAVYGTLTAVVLRSMLGLCCVKTYSAMTNYYNGDDDRDDDGDDNGDDDGNADGNDDDNTTSGSGSDGPIFNPITTPRSRGRGSGNDGDGAVAAAHYISTL